jgi:hypothetical protein
LKLVVFGNKVPHEARYKMLAEDGYQLWDGYERILTTERRETRVIFPIPETHVHVKNLVGWPRG